MWNLLPILQKILNSKIFLYCVIGGLVWFYITNSIKTRETIHRLENNQIAYAQQSSMQIQLTTAQFKLMEPKLDSIAKLVKLKPKDITNVIVNNYHYKDTTIVTVPLTPKDSTSKDTFEFISPMKCGYVKGLVDTKNLTIRITDIDLKDTLDTYLYEDYDRFLGFLWKRNKRYEAVTYSECQHKVIHTQKNVKIIK